MPDHASNMGMSSRGPTPPKWSTSPMSRGPSAMPASGAAAEPMRPRMWPGLRSASRRARYAPQMEKPAEYPAVMPKTVSERRLEDIPAQLSKTK